VSVRKWWLWNQIPVELGQTSLGGMLLPGMALKLTYRKRVAAGAKELRPRPMTGEMVSTAADGRTTGLPRWPVAPPGGRRGDVTKRKVNGSSRRGEGQQS